jgi:hypothetical protein
MIPDFCMFTEFRDFFMELFVTANLQGHGFKFLFLLGIFTKLNDPLNIPPFQFLLLPQLLLTNNC